METLYGETFLTLADGDKTDFDHTKFDNAAEWLHGKKKFDADMLAEQPARELMDETYRVLRIAVGKSITQEVPEELTTALEQNTFIFSGFKAYHQLREASALLKDDNGSFKPFDTFRRDVEKIDNTYNRNYLNAEYNFAVQSTQMAVKWKDFEKDGDDYLLQYRTAGDDKVRADHAVLHNTTLPMNDPFWDEYYPPLGWNCRCTAVQVRKNKYPVSDSAQAIAAGEAATSLPKQKIFRFNPGKTMKVFPPKHPYSKVPKEVKEVVKALVEKQQPILGTKKIKTEKDLSNALANVAKTNSEWFKQGFKEIKTETNPRDNGSTDLNGTIWLNKQHRDNCISAFERIRNGKPCTKDEERSMATLWHEITHNRHKNAGSNDFAGSITSKSRKYMEIANEFVARKTLPEFYKKLGGKMQYPEFVSDRGNSGYNKWVVKYQNAIKNAQLDESAVLNCVQEHLFNQPYNKQKDGLVNALYEEAMKTEAGKKLGKTEVKKQCKDKVEELLI